MKADCGLLVIQILFLGSAAFVWCIVFWPVALNFTAKSVKMLVYGPNLAQFTNRSAWFLRNLTKQYFFEFTAFDSVVNLKSLF